mgnify:CR=1 FL=1
MGVAFLAPPGGLHCDALLRRSGREDWSTEHARLLADLTRTVDVMETVARVEMAKFSPRPALE